MNVFADASMFEGQCAGAYIIGEGEPVMMLLECGSALDAEMLILANAVVAAGTANPGERIVAHTDVLAIPSMILCQKSNRGKSWFGMARQLRHVLRVNNAVVLTDAIHHPEHHRCHYAARLKVGVYGTQHPRMLPV